GASPGRRRQAAARGHLQRDRAVPVLPDVATDRRAAHRGRGVPGARPRVPDRPHHAFLDGRAGRRRPAGLRGRGGHSGLDRGGLAMTWIALKMLTGDRAKFFGIVMGLTFAALLINQQGSIFCGLMCRTAGQVYDITGADLWVMDANVRYIDDVKPMLENNLYRVPAVDG